MSLKTERTLVSRTIEGVDTLVSAEPGELFIDVPSSNPRYIRVEEGETVQEGDIRSRTEEELASVSLTKWTIEAIGPETVIGTDQETGERHEWDRESLERKLAIGELSTTLTDFERVNVTETTFPPNHDGRRSGEESVTVTIYGNDSRKFGQTYALVDEGDDGDERRLELVDSDGAIDRFEPELRAQLDQAVELALRNEGFAV